ncbi:EAL domain-containing protein [Roseateles sp. DXS20W]|uniref:EAL domain-containing protein n=1 Tax=Pelomonas lactea TaxID=3299030 RepID=A0ABW7GMB0_9BURK
MTKRTAEVRDPASKTFWQPPAFDGERPGAARRWLGGAERGALAAALLYAVFGVTWVLWSDRLLFESSSELAVLRPLGQWKGLAFVALSALWVGVAGWRHRDLPATAQMPGGRRLMAVLSLAAVAIIGVGMAGAIHASRGERREVSQMLAAMAQARGMLWAAWLQERQKDAASRRDDAELLQLLARRERTEPDEPASPLLAGHLRELCVQLRCLDARIAEAAPGPDVAVIAVGDARADGAPQRVLAEVGTPLVSAAGAAARLVLRFDATPTLAALLAAGDASRARLLLSRHAGSGWHWLEAAPAGGLAGRVVAQAGASGWPGRGADGQPAPLVFDATLDAQRAFVGAAVPAGSGWSLLAVADAGNLYRHAWGELLWIVAADLAALVLLAFGVYGLQQRRELLASRRERAEQAEKLRALNLLEAVTNSTPALVFTKDLRGRFTFVNQATCRALGQPAQAVLGARADAFLPPEDCQRIAALNDEVVQSGRTLASEGPLTTALGRRWYLRTLGPLRDADGSISGIFGVVHDITERRQQEERHRQWAQAFESTRDGVIICDAAGRIESVNPAFTEITGYAPADAIGRTPALLHSGRHDAEFYRQLWRGITEQGHWRGEIWNRRKDGEIYPEWLTISAVRDDAGAITNYVGVFTDITRVKRDEAELQRLANYDPLTELPNRRLLIARLEQALARTQRLGGRTALLYIDLDGFKTVNDSLGHPAGDELLVEMARRLGGRIRRGDTLGRLGGDEFLVIAESLNGPQEAAVLAQDLIDAVARVVTLGGGHEVYVTASIGISLFPDDGCSDATAMMRDADAALYRAKEQGRNRLCFFTHDLNRQAVARLDIEVALSQALDRGELRLHYQPKVGAASGRVMGAEALLRWQRGADLVPPGLFVPIAEQSSLILEIGAWVIDQACAQLARWRADGLAMPRIAVNVAARQFAAGDLDRVVGQALRRHGVPPACLELEVTESMLIDRPGEGVDMLRRLKDLGVKLSLDDFGTGYSSLAYLRQFPIDALKVDKSFVDHIGIGPDGSAIVDAVISLAHRLGLAVVAEGVETPAQQAHLRAQGCDELQGYGLARPMPADAFEAWCAGREVAAAA